MGNPIDRNQKLRRLVRQRRSNASQRAKHISSRLENPILFSSIIAGILILTFLAWGGYQFHDLNSDLPDLEQLPKTIQTRDSGSFPPTQFYDRTDTRLIYTLENPGITSSYLRIDPTHPGHFSPTLVNAVLKLYEPGFWSNPGFSFQYLFSKQPATITECLVGQYLIPGGISNTRQGLQLRILAAQAIPKYGRTTLLEWFLNNAYFGHMAYGADQAARLYLGKSASNLDLAETAFLLGVYEAPALNPIDVPQATEELKNTVLEKLLAGGTINQGEYLQAKQTRIQVVSRPEKKTGSAPAFVHLATQQLGTLFNRQQLERGGYRITTTLDLDLQKEVECTARVQLLRMQGKPDNLNKVKCTGSTSLPSLPPSEQAYPDSLISSILVEDTVNGEILAYSGDIGTGGLVNPVSMHEPGSLLTPFVAAAAFSRGLSPSSLVWDTPLSSDASELSSPDPGTGSRGPMSLRTAIANDFLLPIQRILFEIGPQDVWRIASPFGLGSLENEKEPGQLIYRGGPVTMPAIATSYSIFSNQGYLVGSTLTGESPVTAGTILKITGSSGIIFNSSPRTVPVLSRQLAYLVHDVISDGSSRQLTLGKPNSLEIGQPAGIKIGQLEDKTGVWAVGYTPLRLVVIWTGLPAGGKSTTLLGYKGAAGLWNAVTSLSMRGLTSKNWEVPPGVTRIQVCDPSGLLPTSACPSVVSEIFQEGNEPVTTDNLYRVYQVNRETGRQATIYTPPELVEERTYLVPPPEAVEWAKKTGLELPPRDYDTIQPAAGSPDAQLALPQAFSTIRGEVNIEGTASGNQFMNYRMQVGQGLFPRAWTQVGEEIRSPVVNALLGKWDTRKQPDGLYAVRLVVTRKDRTIESSAVQVTVDNTPPHVQVIFPAPGQQIKLLDNPDLNITVTADDQSEIASVEWFVDGNRLAVSEQPPYQATWHSQAGKHQLYIRVVDMVGNETSTPPLDFSLQ
jgi:membrane peptidoglycan carboxypeptidase